MRRALLMVAVAGAASAVAADAGVAQTIAITGGTVYPVSGPRIENGTVLIRDGRIVAVGAGVDVPADAQRVDASGRWVTPGFINPWTSVGLVEIGMSAGANDNVATGAEAIAAGFEPWHALNAESPMIAQARHDGITSLGVVPSGHLFAGQAALIDLAGSTAQQLVRRAPAGVVAQLGSAGAGGTGARGELVARLREVLRDARLWPQRRTAVEENRSRELAASAADLDALQPVLRGEAPLFIEVERAAEIDAALALAADHRIRIVLVGAGEAWMRAREIAAARVPVVVGGIRNIPSSFDALNTRGDNAARLRAAGVDVVLFSDSYGDGEHFNARNVRFEAGNAVASGMSWDDALRAVTLAPATLFGVAADLGSLQPGRVANVVVWSGDPFEFATQAEHVFIRGERMTGPTREQLLTERYRTLPPVWRR